MADKKIYPIIMNKNFHKVCLFDDYISLIWTPRYYSPGDFELCLPVTQKSLNYIKKDYYIVRDDDENVGIIQNILFTNDQFGNKMMIVRGKFLAGILERRIIEEQTNFDNTPVSGAVWRLLNDAIIDPDVEARKIENFKWHAYTTEETITQQITGKNLCSAIEDICKAYDLGFKVTLNTNQQFVFSLYRGLDRTYDQNVNPRAIFSDKYDNLLASQYEEIYSTMVTDVLVAGEGEGLDRTTVWATKGNKTGLNRYELYKDARNVRSNSGEIGPAYYERMLRMEGMESMTTYTRAFSGEVDFDNVKYKEDINIGDLCVIQNTKWGVYVNARLIEVIESIDESGKYTINPTFGV